MDSASFFFQSEDLLIRNITNGWIQTMDKPRRRLAALLRTYAWWFGEHLWAWEAWKRARTWSDVYIMCRIHIQSFDILSVHMFPYSTPPENGPIISLFEYKIIINCAKLDRGSNYLRHFLSMSRRRLQAYYPLLTDTRMFHSSVTITSKSRTWTGTYDMRHLNRNNQFYTRWLNQIWARVSRGSLSMISTVGNWDEMVEDTPYLDGRDDYAQWIGTTAWSLLHRNIDGCFTRGSTPASELRSITFR